MPSFTEVNGEPLIVGASFTLVTLKLKAGNAVLKLLSETLITIPAVVPTSALVGLPDKVPLIVLKSAQLGLLTIPNVNVVLVSTSAPVGVKL